MISIVVPIYNEEEIIPLLHEAVIDAMREVDERWEVVYVNDGSKDASLELLRALQEESPEVVVVDLSRNWGHMGALWAGMQTARGDAVVLMDGDLQDPPAVIPEMVAAWKNGAQVVTTVRRSREERRKLLAFLFPLFYRVLGALSDFPIPLNSGIFGLLDRQAIDSINSLREANRYLPGLRAWVGYRTAIVYYDRHDRVGGEGKLTFLSRIKYAMDAITSFSYKPLRMSFVLASLMIFSALVSGLVALLSSNSLGYGIATAIFLTGGLLLFCLGLLGEYVGRIYDEVRARPLSLINTVYEPGEIGLRQLAGHQSHTAMERIFPAA
ncbi:MAG TPA: glycosyltransferase family 2 protein [Terriglobales bacterium]|jgi:glycosyltransferase involved in cell wall biosynthesis|nr:glycosyltransferase family 2 protein [Terriglobales bacterium]